MTRRQAMSMMRVVIGIHTPARAEELAAFLRENEVPFPVGVDRDTIDGILMERP